MAMSSEAQTRRDGGNPGHVKLTDSIQWRCDHLVGLVVRHQLVDVNGGFRSELIILVCEIMVSLFSSDMLCAVQGWHGSGMEDQVTRQHDDIAPSLWTIYRSGGLKVKSRLPPRQFRRSARDKQGTLLLAVESSLFSA